MTRLLTSVLFLIALTACKKDSIAPVEEIAAIVGKWRIVKQQYNIADSTVTEAVPRGSSWVYVFRADGVLVNENGYKPCCIPEQYSLNGKEFKPEPANPAIFDPFCANVYCVSCPEMSITHTTPDTLVIETCSKDFKTFVREQ
ncbi:hypothetical protein [Dyadobacter sandarakinus]|uniref:Lipocalin-like domain-containing protein n=1 Tax=Dyadobacter sandarakinus TaxID=2747268 RepID=A0ABX7IAC1_9BACT|nr:hypothetical protein [Dyadobacter sandarakinus]QRR02482.1 hypothetical protein HWI92_16985 [Dyadobacter sandarakinus]